MVLERVQNKAFRNILKSHDETYDKSLDVLNMETRYQRREYLLLT